MLKVVRHREGPFPELSYANAEHTRLKRWFIRSVEGLSGRDRYARLYQIWRRDIGGHCFRSTLRAGCVPGTVAERFGALTFVFELVGSGEGIDMCLRRWSVLGIPMPRVLGPRIAAIERSEGGQFSFAVDIVLPGLGRLVRYSGTLTPL